MEHLETLGHQLHVLILTDLKGRGHIKPHQLWQGPGSARPIPAFDLVGRLRVSGPPAFRAGDIHIRQELYVQADLPGPVAHRAAQLSCVIGEVAGLISGLLCLREPGVELAQLIMDIGVGGYGRADIDPNRRGVDQLDPFDALGLHPTDVLRKRPFLQQRPGRG